MCNWFVAFFVVGIVTVLRLWIPLRLCTRQRTRRTQRTPHTTHFPHRPGGGEGRGARGRRSTAASRALRRDGRGAPPPEGMLCHLRVISNGFVWFRTKGTESCCH